MNNIELKEKPNAITAVLEEAFKDNSLATKVLTEADEELETVVTSNRPILGGDSHTWSPSSQPKRAPMVGGDP